MENPSNFVDVDEDIYHNNLEFNNLENQNIRSNLEAQNKFVSDRIKQLDNINVNGFQNKNPENQSNQNTRNASH